MNLVVVRLQQHARSLQLVQHVAADYLNEDMACHARFDAPAMRLPIHAAQTCWRASERVDQTNLLLVEDGRSMLTDRRLWVDDGGAEDDDGLETSERSAERHHQVLTKRFLNEIMNTSVNEQRKSVL